MSNNHQYQNKNARETKANSYNGATDVTRSVLGKNAIFTDARTSKTQQTAEDLIREARMLQDLTRPAAGAGNAPHALLTTPEEIAFFRQKHRDEMETLVQKNFRQLNNWIKYAEWEESQKDYVRARSVYERAIPSHGAKPQLWRQYAEMEMRCPPPPMSKALLAAQQSAASGLASHQPTGANLSVAPSSTANAEVLSMLGVAVSGSNAKTASSSSSVTFARSSSAAAASSSSSTAGALMVLSGGGGSGSTPSAMSAALSTVIALPTVQPSEKLSQLDAIVQRGGPEAVVARVRTVLDRALASLPQCDDLWLKYILFETTIATTTEDDDRVRSLFKRWMQYVDLPHVFELFVDFEIDMAAGGGGGPSASSAVSEARRERVNNLLAQLVRTHNTITAWLFYADVMEGRIGDPLGAIKALLAAAVALGPIGKFAHNGVLFQQLGRLYGAVGQWASEGRSALRAAIVEAQAIEEKAKADAALSSSASVVVTSSIVSETLLTAYSVLERSFGGHDPVALHKLSLMNQKFAYAKASEKILSDAPNVSWDAPNVSLALRLAGCGRDEGRLENVQQLMKDASSASSPPLSSSSLANASYVVKTNAFANEEGEGSGAANAKATGTSQNLDTLSELFGKKTHAAVAAEGRNDEELAILRKAIGDQNAKFKAMKAANTLANAPATVKDSYANLLLGAVDILVTRAREESATSASALTTEARELARAALDFMPNYSPSLWITAAKLEVQVASSASNASSASTPAAVIAERVRKIYGAAIANLSVPPATATVDGVTAKTVVDQALHAIYDSYIGFEKAIGGSLTQPQPHAPSPSPAAASSSSSSAPMTASEGVSLIESMGGGRGVLTITSGSTPPSLASSADTIRRLYMEALKRFPTSVEWWVAFATFELSLQEPDRCFKLLEKAEGVLKASQAQLSASIEQTAASGTTTTRAQRAALEAEAKEVRSKIEQLRGSRVGLLLQSGRGQSAMEIYVDAIRTTMSEYTVSAVAAVENHSGAAAFSSTASTPDAQRNDMLVQLDAYSRLHTLLKALPSLAAAAATMKMLQAPPPSANAADGKARGDDVASKAYAYVSALYRALAVELRKMVATRMSFTNVAIAMSVVEPFLNIWRAFEGQHGTIDSVKAVSCTAEPPAAQRPTNQNESATAEATSAQTVVDVAPTTVTVTGKKRKRLADLAENY